MKNFIVLPAFTGLFLLASCQEKPAAPAPKTQTPADTIAFVPLPIDPRIEGFWVEKNWWQTLQSTKSPLVAAENSGIDAIIIQQDTSGWVADLTYAWHEGQRFQIVSYSEKLALLNAYENNKKEHDLLPHADGSLHLDTSAYQRIGDWKTGEAAISASILGGEYSQKERPGKVKFNLDGTVTGLEPYTRYALLLDYVVEPTPLDQLILMKNPDEQGDFLAYEISDSSLNIYEMICNDPKEVPCFEYKLGKVKYGLRKKGK